MRIISDKYQCRHFGCGMICKTELGRAYHEQLNHPHVTNMYDASMDLSHILNDKMATGNEAFSVSLLEQVHVKNEKIFLDGYI